MNSWQLSNVIKEFASNATKRCLSYKSNTQGKLKIEPQHIVIMGDSKISERIAQLSIQAGHNVALIYTSERPQIRVRIRENLKNAAKGYSNSPRAQDKFLSESMNRLQHSRCFEKDLRTADIVVVAPEFGASIQDLKVKRKLLKTWSSIARPDSIVVFGQPTWSPHRRLMADGFILNSFKFYHKIVAMLTAPSRRHNILEVNFVYPFLAYKIAEIIPIYKSSSAVINRTILWLEEMKVTPVMVHNQGDVERNLMILNQCLHYAENVDDRSAALAQIDQITTLKRSSKTTYFVVMLLEKVSHRFPEISLFDKLYKNAYKVALRSMKFTKKFENAPAGPVQMTDNMGLDKAKQLIDETLYTNEQTGRKRSAESQLLKDLVDKGKLGRKTGQGFYIYR